MYVFWQSAESLFDLGTFVFPLRVWVAAFSVFEEGFFGFIKDLQQSFVLLAMSFMEKALHYASYKLFIVLYRMILDFKRYISPVTDRLLS